MTELNGHAAPQKTPHEVSSDYYPSLPEQNGYDLSDDSSVEGNEDHQRKPLVRRTLDDLELSSDDEDIFTTHRDQMVQYMIHVYRRRQQVIDDYEEKRMVSQPRVMSLSVLTQTPRFPISSIVTR